MASRSVTKTYTVPLPRISRRTALVRIALLSLVAAIILFGVLTLQMALGKDPAIGAGPTVVASTPPPTPQVSTPTPQVSIPTPTPVQTSAS